MSKNKRTMRDARALSELAHIRDTKQLADARKKYEDMVLRPLVEKMLEKSETPVTNIEFQWNSPPPGNHYLPPHEPLLSPDDLAALLGCPKAILTGEPTDSIKRDLPAAPAKDVSEPILPIDRPANEQ